MAKQKTPPPQQPQGKKTSKEQKPEKLFETGDGAAARITPRLRTHYEQVVRPQLQQQFNYKNPMLCTSVPTGMFCSGSALPGRMSASGPFITVAPTSNPTGARM